MEEAAELFIMMANTMTLSLYGCKIQHNDVVQHGSSILFLSPTIIAGICTLRIVLSRENTGGSWYPVYESIFNA